ARPFDEAHRDRTVRSAMDRRQDARIGQRRRVALALQLELPVIDAARNIGGEDNLEVCPGCTQFAGKGEEDQKYDRGESGSHRASSCSTPSEYDGSRYRERASPVDVICFAKGDSVHAAHSWPD